MSKRVSSSVWGQSWARKADRGRSLRASRRDIGRGGEGGGRWLVLGEFFALGYEVEVLYVCKVLYCFLEQGAVRGDRDANCRFPTNAKTLADTEAG